MTDHDPCVCPICREAGMRNNPDKMIADLRTKLQAAEVENDRLREALEGFVDSISFVNGEPTFVSPELIIKAAHKAVAALEVRK